MASEQKPIVKADIESVPGPTGIFPPHLTPTPIVPKIGDHTLEEIRQWYASSENDLIYAKSELEKSMF